MKAFLIVLIIVGVFSIIAGIGRGARQAEARRRKVSQADPLYDMDEISVRMREDEEIRQR